MCKRISIPFKTDLLQKGMNSFEFKVTDGAYFSIPIDGSHHYGRSFFLRSGKQEDVDGEYQVSLWFNRR